MAHNREKGGRVVFIGNIPYGVSEEQICEIFGRAGTVVNFRLVYDKETGRPKGFGFLEYTDVDAAAAAVRNLNEFELNGRTLRVDYSNDNDKGNRGGGGGGQGGGGGNDFDRAPPPAHFAMPTNSNGLPPDALPPLPPGVTLPPGLSAPDAISTTLQKIEAPQLLDILSQMKTLTTQEPARATALLAQAPQLGYAIFQALLQMRLVGTDVLAGLIQNTAPPPAAAQAPPPAMSYAQPPQQFAPPPQAYGQPPPQQYAQGYAPTPPVQQQAYAPPPQQAPPQASPFGGGQSNEQLMQTIMGLTREQVYGLDEAARNQILALRSQLGMPML